MLDWAAVKWPLVAVLAAMAFVASFVGSLFVRNALVVAILTAIIFSALYVAWAHYPPVQNLPWIPRPS